MVIVDDLPIIIAEDPNALVIIRLLRASDHMAEEELKRLIPEPERFEESMRKLRDMGMLKEEKE